MAQGEANSILMLCFFTSLFIHIESYKKYFNENNVNLVFKPDGYNFFCAFWFQSMLLNEWKLVLWCQNYWCNKSFKVTVSKCKDQLIFTLEVKQTRCVIILVLWLEFAQSQAFLFFLDQRRSYLQTNVLNKRYTCYNLNLQYRQWKLKKNVDPWNNESSPLYPQTWRKSWNKMI